MQSVRRSLLALGLLLTLRTVAGYGWSSCADGTPLQPTAVQLEPSDVHSGQDLVITITATLNSAAGPVQGGNLKAAVKYHGIQVYSASDALCNTVACPIQPGSSIDIKSQQKMPGWAPHGPYQFKFEGTLEAADVMGHTWSESKSESQGSRWLGNSGANTIQLICVEVHFDMH